MPLSANSVVFLEMTILAESGVTFFEHEKKCVRISTVFRHCVRAFLLCSSTFCVHFYYSSTVFQHWLRAFPLLREAFWIVLDYFWAAQRSGKLSERSGLLLEAF